MIRVFIGLRFCLVKIKEKFKVCRDKEMGLFVELFVLMKNCLYFLWGGDIVVNFRLWF